MRLFWVNSECSVHLLDEWVDELLSVTPSSHTLAECLPLDLEATEWGGQLEWPQEVVSLLELGSAGDDLVDEVLNAVDAVLAELASNDAVVGKWDSASIDLSVSSLVDQLGDVLSGWVAESDEWLDDLDHVPGGLVELDEDAVVELSKSEELQDLLWLWSELVDTLDSNQESNLSLALNQEGSLLLALSLLVDELLIGGSILLGVLLSTGESGLSGSSSVGLCSFLISLSGLGELLVSGDLFLDVLGHNALLLWHLECFFINDKKIENS